MKFASFARRLGVFLLLLGLAFMGWSSYGWGGVAFVASAAVFWGLLHFNRLMQVLKRAANRPIGHVGSAVMLNAKLRNDVSLLHVVALTRSLGELRSAKDAQPEIYRWTDGTQSHVSCEFVAGRLVRWQLERPPVASDTAPV